jgi:hypothetical protein
MGFAVRGLLVALAFVLSMAACNATEAPAFDLDGGLPDCTAGETRVCECPPKGLPGVQVCRQDGTWGECDCTNDDPCGDAALLVIDRSGSMGSESKWTEFLVAVEDTLAPFDDHVEMGMVILPDETCDPTDTQNLTKLCRPPTNVSVDIGSGNLPAIMDKLEMLGTCGGTPTAGALDKALDAVKAAGRETQVILITDGLPNCNLDADGESCDCAVGEPSNYCYEHPEQCIDLQEVARAASDLFLSGAPVHVLGYAIDTEWINVMEVIAAEGGTEESSYCPTVDSLSISLKRIFESIIDC